MHHSHLNRRQRVKRTNRQGVVLLIVLVAIVVLGAALTQVARANSRANIAVQRQQRALQQRWGMLTCQRAVLPAGQGAFLGSDFVAKQSAKLRQKYRHQIADQVELGGQKFDLLLADEDAKANLNAIYDLGGTSACEKAMRDTIDLGDSRSIQLRPQRRSLGEFDAAVSRAGSSRLGNQQSGSDQGDDDEAADEIEPGFLPPAFRSWGDVLDFDAVIQNAGDVRQIAKTTQNVTLWGTGRLNVWRASDDAIIAVCREVVQDGLARRIQQRVRTAPLSQIDLVLRQTVTNEEDRRKVSELLADSSQCASLWVEANDGQTRRQQLSVLISDETGLTRTIVFQFP
ncbi:hypothetical protein [Planctomycetes bacterium K23_9]|uniref:General secretion pathway protein K n=1 Tax=Stieleria marina TaxID=1930275 RepID=A0A517NNX3_9BACT|nr:hypothetical protein K239x_07560 [Planctomycetes bacterium K23_9]